MARVICPSCGTSTNCPKCQDDICLSCGTDLAAEENIPFCHNTTWNEVAEIVLEEDKELWQRLAQQSDSHNVSESGNMLRAKHHHLGTRLRTA